MVLKGKVAIITGAGRGIGRAIAIEFARRGSAVVCSARTEEDIQGTASLIKKNNGQCLPVPTDVADKHQVHGLVEQAIKQFGHIDVLVNNAARIPVISGLWEVDPDAWWEEVTVDLRGPMLCTHAVLPHMIRQNSGIIINMAGGTNIPGRTSYCCSKVALNRLTVLLARELQSIGSSVIVFDMGPGLVKTRRTLHEAQSEQGMKWNPGTRRAFESGQDRPPEDCARAMIKLVIRAGAELNGKSFSTADILRE
jgi:NAD(P)-dependent dehydrogenase (short-subunit alcohol dehydrogenase family)